MYNNKYSRADVQFFSITKRILALSDVFIQKIKKLDRKFEKKSACNALGLRMAVISQAVSVISMLERGLIHTFLGLNLAGVINKLSNVYSACIKSESSFMT